MFYFYKKNYSNKFCYLDFLPDFVEGKIESSLRKVDAKFIQNVFNELYEEMPAITRKYSGQNLESMRGLVGYIKEQLLPSLFFENRTLFSFDSAISREWEEVDQKLLFEQMQSDFTLLCAVYENTQTKEERNKEAYSRKYYYFLALRLICCVGDGWSIDNLQYINNCFYISLLEKKPCCYSDLQPYTRGEKIDTEGFIAFNDFVLGILKENDPADVIADFDAVHGVGAFYAFVLKIIPENAQEKFVKEYQRMGSKKKEIAEKRRQEAWADILGFDFRNIKPEYRSEYNL